ncbi:hypothetical protein [Amphibacillus indicireducens]|uniref:Uncharacterized protein n=1 Tax=Amphibacillus indicireducens TaxID=1076330 RepID=A0ABP7VJZ3_9BACI
MKRLKRKLNQMKEIMQFRMSRRVNNHYVIERRLASFYHDRQVQRIRQIY